MIRPAENRDINEINDLLLQVAMVHHCGRPDLFKANSRKYTTEQVAEILKNSQTPVFVYTDADDKAVGYAFCVIQHKPKDNAVTDIKTLYIDDLCVNENSRGQHIGKQLYSYVVDYAKKIGCYNVTLNVWCCNESAMKFYQSCGLKPQKIGMECIL